ncbi:MAG: hypothetical protein C0620_01230 [Desulfuromonas sp.]|nr:MAG: hypothetical protein C0620_01230 [Desulfuromonas sp.]
MLRNQETQAAVVLYCLLMLLFITMATLNPTAYIWLTYEDLLGEWSQVFLFLAALLLSLVLAVRRKKYSPFFTLLTLACLYVVGEEISWGQRLLNLNTPVFFQQHNLQQETNLHNFITGPFDTALKQAIEIVLASALITFSTLYAHPISDRLPVLGGMKRWVPPPPGYLWPYFCTAALFELRIFRFNEAELAEILIAAGLVFYTFHHLFKQEHTLATRPRRKALAAVFAFAVVGAMVTTGLCYNTPRLHEEMNARIDNGMSKFADRYGRYGQWQHSRHLYMKLLEKRPNSVVLLQRLAYAEKKLGHDFQATQALTEAIRLDMRRYSREPGDIAVNLSLAKSFIILGNEERQSFHLQQALDYGLRRVRLEPANANALYWLGRAYLSSGDTDKAVEQFQQATLLDPTVYRFQRALHEARLKDRSA